MPDQEKARFNTKGKLATLLIVLLTSLPIMFIFAPNRALAACPDGYTEVEGVCVPVAGGGEGDPIRVGKDNKCLTDDGQALKLNCDPKTGKVIQNPGGKIPPASTSDDKDGSGNTYQQESDPVTKAKCDKDGKNCKLEVKGCNDKSSSCGKIMSTLVSATNLLSAAVGIIAVAMIVFGGIEFSTSGGDPQKVASGKKHITNAIIALVAFVFLWAFLNFLIPGGLFNG